MTKQRTECKSIWWRVSKKHRQTNRGEGEQEASHSDEKTELGVLAGRLWSF